METPKYIHTCTICHVTRENLNMFTAIIPIQSFCEILLTRNFIPTNSGNNRITEWKNRFCLISHEKTTPI